MTKQEELWIEVRKLLVEFNIMNPDGSPTEGHEKACMDMRKLILKGNENGKA